MAKNNWDDDIMARTQKGRKDAFKKASEKAMGKIKKAAAEGKSEITMKVPKHARQRFVTMWNAEHPKVTAHHFVLHKHITFKWD